MDPCPPLLPLLSRLTPLKMFGDLPEAIATPEGVVLGGRYFSNAVHVYRAITIRCALVHMGQNNKGRPDPMHQKVLGIRADRQNRPRVLLNFAIRCLCCMHLDRTEWHCPPIASGVERTTVTPTNEPAPHLPSVWMWCTNKTRKLCTLIFYPPHSGINMLGAKRKKFAAHLPQPIRKYTTPPAHQVTLSACRVPTTCLTPDFHPCSIPPEENFNLSLSLSFAEEFFHNLMGTYGAPPKRMTHRILAPATVKRMQKAEGEWIRARRGQGNLKTIGWLKYKMSPVNLEDIDGTCLAPEGRPNDNFDDFMYRHFYRDHGVGPATKAWRFSFEFRQCVCVSKSLKLENFGHISPSIGQPNKTSVERRVVKRKPPPPQNLSTDHGATQGTKDKLPATPTILGPMATHHPGDGPPPNTNSTHPHLCTLIVVDEEINHLPQESNEAAASNPNEADVQMPPVEAGESSDEEIWDLEGAEPAAVAHQANILTTRVEIITQSQDKRLIEATGPLEISSIVSSTRILFRSTSVMSQSAKYTTGLNATGTSAPRQSAARV